ncbi:MAG: hypothetical protein JWO45_1578 [Spartobacteria bacterium]|nr:hypothetical protein [Spartobacteria bacterium]
MAGRIRKVPRDKQRQEQRQERATNPSRAGDGRYAVDRMPDKSSQNETKALMDSSEDVAGSFKFHSSR